MYWIRKVTKSAARARTPATRKRVSPSLGSVPFVSASTMPESAVASTPTGSILLMLTSTDQNTAAT